MDPFSIALIVGAVAGIGKAASERGKRNEAKASQASQQNEQAIRFQNNQARMKMMQGILSSYGYNNILTPEMMDAMSKMPYRKEILPSKWGAVGNSLMTAANSGTQGYFAAKGMAPIGGRPSTTTTPGTDTYDGPVAPPGRPTYPTDEITETGSVSTGKGGIGGSPDFWKAYDEFIKTGQWPQGLS